MKTAVICYSKTGNTRTIADAIAGDIGADVFPLNTPERGRGTRPTREAARRLMSDALEAARQVDLVIVGTPTQFRRPHARVMEFIDHLQASKVAVFCPYYGMLGATLIDMEARLRQKGLRLVGRLGVRVGTETYRFRRNVNEYAERITRTHLIGARGFGRECSSATARAIAPRLRGVCGKSCRTCAQHQRGCCEGAATKCWSGSNCRVFDCCVIKKSLAACEACEQVRDCRIRRSVAGRAVAATR